MGDPVPCVVHVIRRHPDPLAPGTRRGKGLDRTGEETIDRVRHELRALQLHHVPRTGNLHQFRVGRCPAIAFEYRKGVRRSRSPHTTSVSMGASNGTAAVSS